MPARKPTIVGVVAFLLFTVPLCAIQAATSISFSNGPKTIDESQDFTIDVSLICTGCTSDSYLRGVFYPSGTSYFGYTQDNAGNWVNATGGSCTEYFKVAATDPKEGSWSGTLKIKPDKENAFYSGPGEYLFKVGRYTGSCGTTTWSSEMVLTITGPTKTPTPTIPPSSTPLPTSIPTSVPTHTMSPTNTMRPTPSSTIKPTLEIVDDEEASKQGEMMVLGEVTGERSSGTSSANLFAEKRPYIIALLFIGAGFALLGAVIAVKIRLYSKQ